ncbi:MAG: hypothetical protein QOJ65_1712 [Fimbriimonadaceae bacterium]|nr:hypothetical protein [Fimbriimonadaceae bacterium]
MKYSFKNFSVWRGRLPHWRAEEVTYYVTFRHRRALDEAERRYLLQALVRPDARRWDLLIACVLPEATELMFVVRDAPSGQPYELSNIVEKAKAKVGRLIIKNTGEKYPPFYAESYDRILRDQAELEERWQAILESPVSAELAEDPEDYEGLYVPQIAPEAPMPAS